MKLALLFLVFFVQNSKIVEIRSVSVGIIRNVSLDILHTNATVLSSSCHECLCTLLANASFFALNCLAGQLTCELHSKLDQNKPFALLPSTNATFCFLSLPTFVATHEGEYLWTFDSTFQDTSSTYNATPINSPGYSTTTITGYGSSLSLNSSLAQYLSVAQPFVKLYRQSWTFEAWIYLWSLTDADDYALVGQCDVRASDRCLHLLVRNSRLFLGFYNDDVSGVTKLIALRWYHIAFAFETGIRNQSVYLDGVLNADRQANSEYQGTSGSLNIGMRFTDIPKSFFNGLIDQFSFTNRSKTSQEILRDATLTLHFAFDGNSTSDQGPLAINASLVGTTGFVSGPHGQALHVAYVSDSYFAVKGLVLLGRDNQSYSFSIWINPSVVKRASIIHMSSASDGTEWCSPMLGLTDTSRLAAASWSGTVVMLMGPIVPTNTWTHVVSTYSLSNGLRLYVNGSLSNASAAFSFIGSGTPNYLFVGSPRAGINCRSLTNISGQYSGAVDELRVYSRELTPDDIVALATL